MLLLSALDRVALAALLDRYGLTLCLLAPNEVIPGSYWGESEAGLKGDRLYARLDTPLHSVLHEACHYICMTPERRAGLDRDAGGDDLEESAVCYLQVLLASDLRGSGGTACSPTWTPGATVFGSAAHGRGSRATRRTHGRGCGNTGSRAMTSG